MIFTPPILILAAVAFFISFGLTHRLAASYSLLDFPNERSLHSRPVPRSGGLGIVAGLSVACAIALALTLAEQNALFLWLIGLTVFLALVSIVDDKIGLAPAIRFTAHAMAAGLLVWGAGLVIPSVPLPMFRDIPLGLLGAPLAFLCILWVTNLYNFMDGMDGFAGGMTVIGHSFLVYVGWREHHPLIAIVSLFVAASSTGFLVHNFPPARIFLGDIGSIPLGFLTAGVLVLGVRDGLFDVWVATLIFSPFIVDATVTLLKRIARREKVWTPHRQHFYQRLVLAGWSHRRTVLVEYTLMLAAGFSALLYSKDTGALDLGILIGWSMVYLFLTVLVGRVERRISE